MDAAPDRQLVGVPGEPEAGDVGDGVRPDQANQIGGRPVQRPHPADRLVEHRQPALGAAEHERGPERLRQIERVPGTRARLRPDAVRADGADDGEPVLRLGIANRVAAGQHRAGRPHLRLGAVEDGADESRPGSSSGNAATDSASNGDPPIANTSLSAFVAAIAPKSDGSSTIGGKKSIVKTIARSSSSR